MILRLRKHGTVLVAVLVLCFSLISTSTAQAAEASTDFNLTASPLPTNLEARPGQTISTPLKVVNSGNQPVRVKVSLLKFNAYGDSGKPQILDPTEGDAFIKWASFSETSFDAQPNVWKTITMTIKVPKEAAFGYYYAVIFSVDNGRPAYDGTRQTAVDGAIASLLLLDVKAPGEKRSLEVTDFVATKKVYEYVPAEFDIKVKNTGNVHVIPSGNVFITKNGKDILATLDINKGQGNVLPGSSRSFTAEWADGYPSYQVKRVNGQIISGENGQPEKQLSWAGGKLDNFRFGKYKASLTLVYNDGTRDVPVEGEVSFWVIPWKLLGVALIIMILVGLGLWTILRQTSRRVRSRFQKS